MNQMPLVLADCVAKLDADIASNREQFAIISLLLPALQKFDGKAISKRIETAARAALPGYVAYLNTSAGLPRLQVWKGNHKNSVTIYMGNGEPYSHEAMTRPPSSEWQVRQGHAWNMMQAGIEADRLEGLRGELPELVRQHNVALDALKLAIVALPSCVFRDR